MSLKTLSSLLLLVGLLAAGGARAQGDIANGKLQFKKCAVCHAVAPGQNKIGPSLFGVVGRQSASAANFAYSDAMKKFGRIWDVATLDAYLAEPRKIVPGTKMIFPGLKDEKERDDLIAYLATLK